MENGSKHWKQTSEMNTVGVKSKLITNLSNDN